MSNIGVFCGSSFGNSQRYMQAAESLGREIASGKHTLVYGGVDEGLMGVLASTCRKHGGIVRGIVPEVFRDKKLKLGNASEIEWVDSMATRKSVMIELCDCYVVLPGGAGTLEEFAEVWSWSHLVENPKTVVLYNVDSFYDLLLSFLEKASEQGFINPDFILDFPQADCAADAIKMALQPSVARPKWESR